MAESIPAVVLGGTGYVGGELLRLLASHPHMKLAAVVSRSHAQQEVEAVFPNLRGVWPGLRFCSLEELPDTLRDRCAIFSAAAHGASAELIARALRMCERQHCAARVVDASGDFRFPDADAYESVYGLAHGAPDLIPSFGSLLPEHASTRKPLHVGHPGCFATSMLLASVPLMRARLVEPRLMASAVTGSTGAGRGFRETTHHPVRHANMFAYKPLAHRHAPEVEGIVEALTGLRPELHFVPTSGPFARGIYLTLQAQLAAGVDLLRVREVYWDHYADASFVHMLDAPPRLKDVVGGNHAHLSVAVNRGTVAVSVALDNLVKGAAGGAIQWMNLLQGLPQTCGLMTPGPAWI